MASNSFDACRRRASQAARSSQSSGNENVADSVAPVSLSLGDRVVVGNRIVDSLSFLELPTLSSSSSLSSSSLSPIITSASPLLHSPRKLYPSYAAALMSRPHPAHSPSHVHKPQPQSPVASTSTSRRHARSAAGSGAVSHSQQQQQQQHSHHHPAPHSHPVLSRSSSAVAVDPSLNAHPSHHHPSHGHGVTTGGTNVGDADALSIRSVQSGGKKVGKITKLRRKLGLSKKAFSPSPTPSAGSSSSTAGRQEAGARPSLLRRMSFGQVRKASNEGSPPALSASAMDVDSRSPPVTALLAPSTMTPIPEIGSIARPTVSFQEDPGGSRKRASDNSHDAMEIDEERRDSVGDFLGPARSSPRMLHPRASEPALRRHASAGSRSTAKELPKTITIHQSHLGMLEKRKESPPYSPLASPSATFGASSAFFGGSSGSHPSPLQVPQLVSNVPSFSVETKHLSPEILPVLLQPLVEFSDSHPADYDSSGGKDPSIAPAFKPVPLVHAATMDVAGSYPSLWKRTGLADFAKRLPFGSNSQSNISRSSPALTKSTTLEPPSLSNGPRREKSMPANFQHIPLQHFDTIEPAHGGFKASLAWRMKKTKEEQEHITIHTFDRAGESIWDRLNNGRTVSATEPPLSTIGASSGSGVPDVRGLFMQWPEEIASSNVKVIPPSPTSPASTAVAAAIAAKENSLENQVGKKDHWKQRKHSS